MKLNEKNVTAYAICASPVDKHGYLHKRGEVNRGFQRRYFLLKGNLLFYFDRKGEKEPIGVIVLEGCTVELSSDAVEEDCPNVFEIVFQGPGSRTYVLMADSQDEMEGWMKALQCANYDYKRLQVQELQRQLKEIEDREARGDEEGNMVNGAVGGWAQQPRVNPFDKDRFDPPKRVTPKTGVNSRPRGPNRPPPPPPTRAPPPPPVKPAPTTNQQSAGSSTFFAALDTSSFEQNGNGSSSPSLGKASSTWYNSSVESSNKSSSASASSASSAWYTAVPQNISLTQSAPASTSLSKAGAGARPSPRMLRHTVRSTGAAGSSLFYDAPGAKARSFAQMHKDFGVPVQAAIASWRKAHEPSLI